MIETLIEKLHPAPKPIHVLDERLLIFVAPNTFNAVFLETFCSDS